MNTYQVESSKIINAPAEQVYGIIADYHEGHPAILPSRYFSGLEVTEGGQGAGTLITVNMHVFGAKALFEMTYDAQGDPVLARAAINLMEGSGFSAGEDSDRGLDHGAWVPLMMMYPESDIPVIQLSVQTENDPEHHYNLGRSLAPLRESGVLIMGSGGATHNLEDIHGRKMNDSPEKYATAFDDWLEKKIAGGDTDAILDFKRTAPNAVKNHPYPSEHFLPIFPAMGAAGRGAKGKLLHRDFIYGILSLAAYLWEV